MACTCGCAQTKPYAVESPPVLRTGGRSLVSFHFKFLRPFGHLFPRMAGCRLTFSHVESPERKGLVQTYIIVLARTTCGCPPLQFSFSNAVADMHDSNFFELIWNDWLRWVWVWLGTQIFIDLQSVMGHLFTARLLLLLFVTEVWIHVRSAKFTLMLTDLLPNKRCEMCVINLVLPEKYEGTLELARLCSA